MRIPDEYLGKEEAKLLDESGLLFSGMLDGYTKWRSGLKGKPRIRVVFAMNMIFLIAKHTYSIQELVKLGQIDSAKALLRIVIEIYINIWYMYLTSNNTNVYRFGYTTDSLYIKSIDKYENFVATTYSRPKLTGKDFDLFRNKFYTSLDDWDRWGFDGKRMPDLRSRAEYIVKQTGNPQVGELYYNSYSLLSEDVHVTGSIVAAVSVSDNFEEQWFGKAEWKTVKSLLSVLCEVESSAMILIERKSGIYVYPKTLPRDVLLRHNQFYEKTKKV